MEPHGVMVKTFRELRVYQSARRLAKEIFELSKVWPPEERYELTNQIRRSSRSVGANIAECWRKRRFPKHFASKLTDADAEAAETQAWLDTALDCGYINQETFDRLDEQYEHLIGGLVKMRNEPKQWCGPSQVREPETLYEVSD